MKLFSNLIQYDDLFLVMHKLPKTIWSAVWQTLFCSNLQDSVEIYHSKRFKTLHLSVFVNTHSANNILKLTLRSYMSELN